MLFKLFSGSTWKLCFQKFVRMFNLIINMFLYFSRVNLYKQSGFFWLQMHQVCFQSYHASLVRSHCTQTTYEGRALKLAKIFSSIFTMDCKICFLIESSYILAPCTVKGYFWISTKFGICHAGKSIIDLQKIEYFCPICRRLANVLLPAVHQAGLSRMLQACEEEDTTLQRDNWSQFWGTCKNLPSAIDAFAVQVIYYNLRCFLIISNSMGQTCLFTIAFDGEFNIYVTAVHIIRLPLRHILTILWLWCRVWGWGKISLEMSKQTVIQSLL